MKLALLLALAGAACSSTAPEPAAVAQPAAPSAPASVAPESPPAPSAALDPIAALRADVEALMARPEHTESHVTVQHCLIAVEGLLPGVTRSAAEAEARTAELWARLRDGADFDALVRQYTEDAHPGIYTLYMGTPSGAAEEFPREGMVLGFGNVAWRLGVGEYGVMCYDGERFDVEAQSPFGYHILKRLK